MYNAMKLLIATSIITTAGASFAAATSSGTKETTTTTTDCVPDADGVCQQPQDADSANPVTNTTTTPHDYEGFTLHENASILDVLNPDILRDDDLMREVRRRLRRREAVILRDAFVPEFADYVWEELRQEDLDWDHNWEIATDGFSLSHANFYNSDVSVPYLSVGCSIPWLGQGKKWYFSLTAKVPLKTQSWTERMFKTHAVFDHPDTLEWVANLTGRRTYGSPHYASPSRFYTGDYTMPHSDYSQERAVSYVWHLSHDWNPAWGGAFYLNTEKENRHAYVHASYNTLVLFSVTRYSQHMVTVVTDELPEPDFKRLAWNGWWLDTTKYDYTDPVEDLFDTYEKRLTLTDLQTGSLLREGMIEAQVQDPVRAQKLKEWRDNFKNELEEGPRTGSYVIDLYGSAEKDKIRWKEQWDQVGFGDAGDIEEDDEEEEDVEEDPDDWEEE